MTGIVLDVLILAIVAFFFVLAVRKVIMDRKNGVPSCGYACGGACSGACGHVSTEHMDRRTRRAVRQAIRDLKSKQS